MQYGDEIMDNIKWIWRKLGKYKIHLIGIVILTFLYTGAWAIYPYLFKFIVDGIKEGITPSSINRYVLILLCAGGISALLYAFLQALRAYVNMKIEWDTQKDVYAQVVNYGENFFQKNTKGDIITRLVTDNERFSWFACSGVFRTLQGIILMIIGFAILVRINILLTLTAFGPALIMVIVFLIFDEEIYQRYLDMEKLISRVNDMISYVFSGIRVIKGYNKEHLQGNFFSRLMGKRRAAELSVVRLDSFLFPFYIFIGSFSMLVIILLGGRMVITGKITLGDFVAFSGYIFLLIEPMFSVGTFFIGGKKALVSVDRIRKYEKGNKKITVKGKGIKKVEFNKTLEIRNISASSESGYRIKDISLMIKKGSKLGIFGEIGSGKTTLIKVMLKLTDITKGVILLDNKSIQNLDIKAYRDLFGYVPQDPILFSTTIFENIQFGRKWIGKNEIIESAKISQIHNEIMNFPNGYQEIIGEKGITLSGGQKQRVALARALAGKPEILILDDITSRLDTETETALWKILNEKFPSITMVIISHKIASLIHSDEIVVLEKGEIIARGSHNELVNTPGIYQDIYKFQML